MDDNAKIKMSDFDISTFVEMALRGAYIPVVVPPEYKDGAPVENPDDVGKNFVIPIGQIPARVSELPIMGDGSVERPFTIDRDSLFEMVVDLIIDAMRKPIEELNQRISEETEARGQADEELASSVSTEATDRQQADEVLSTHIETVGDEVDELVTRADGLDTSVAELGDRASALEAGVSALGVKLDTETTNRQSADERISGDVDSLRESLSDEAGIRADADSGLSDRIDGLGTDVAGLRSDLTAETDARTQGDNSLSVRIDEVSGDVAQLGEDLATETTAREQADTELNQSILGLQNGLTTEKTARVTEDGALGGRIDTLSGKLNTEIQNRETADSELSGDISSLRGTLNTAIERVDGVNDLQDTAIRGLDGRVGGLETATDQMIPYDAPTGQSANAFAVYGRQSANWVNARTIPMTTVTTAASVTVENNVFTILQDENDVHPSAMTLSVTSENGIAVNFGAQYSPEVDCTLTIVANGNPTMYVLTAGNVMKAGKTYQISCLNDCWVMAAFESP